MYVYTLVSVYVCMCALCKVNVIVIVNSKYLQGHKVKSWEHAYSQALNQNNGQAGSRPRESGRQADSQTAVWVGSV